MLEKVYLVYSKDGDSKYLNGVYLIQSNAIEATKAFPDYWIEETLVNSDISKYSEDLIRHTMGYS